MSHQQPTSPHTLIRLRRRAAGLTQKQLAQRIGVGERQVIFYEAADPSRRSHPSERAAAALAAVLGGTATEYLERQDGPMSPDETSRVLARERQSRQRLERRLAEVEALVEELLREREP
jgi:transcriptional regulator with XRE-family HTH domain